MEWYVNDVKKDVEQRKEMLPHLEGGKESCVHVPWEATGGL